MNKLTDWIRARAEKFITPIAHLISRLHIKPDMLTAAAFVCGIVSVYFFLSNYYWFAVFAIIHIALDILDGAVARVSGSETKRGKWLDWWSDRTVSFLLILKCGWLGVIDYSMPLAVIALVLGIITCTWYFRSKKKVPVFAARSIVLLLGVLKLSLVILPVAILIYLCSLTYQVWYTLNNI